jgi:DNA polymerase-1
MIPASLEAYRLLHEGTLALAEVEGHGIRIDVEYLDRTLIEVEARIKEMKRELRSDAVYTKWRRVFGSKTSLTAPDQLRHMAYEVLGATVKYYTDSNKPSVKASALQEMNNPFISKVLEIRKLEKIHGTFLTGIRRNTIGDRLHASYGLHIAATYRSVANDPNFQNFPVRDKAASKIIRTCFIPSKNHVLIESDYSGIEVRVAACYHRDPVMLTYIKDPSKDMHRDMAAQIYKLKTDQVTKEARHAAKNQFVFPQFYGDYYINCARSMWESIGRYDLKTADGAPLHQHLASNGISRMGRCDPDRKDIQPGSFEKHMREVQDHFWKVRFSKYNAWKERWYKQYLNKGGFNTLTGFYIGGEMGKNDVINYPVQGSAFHCLLWALIRVNQWLKKNKMKSRIVGQIHDSMVGDVHKRERDDYVHHVRRIMVDELCKNWKWIIVPIDVEFEETATNWFDKKAIEVS